MALAALVLLCVSNAAGAGEIPTAPAWQLDAARTGSVSGTLDYWNGYLWGVDPQTHSVWAYDGAENRTGGAVPGDYVPTGHGLFTDHGVYLTAANTKNIAAGYYTASVLRSTDGFSDFRPVLELGNPMGAMVGTGKARSLVDLGNGGMMYFEYNAMAQVYYSEDAGESWRRLLYANIHSPPITHFHGAVFDAANQTLYAMTGDPDTASTILFCDDLYGPHGLINDPDLWRMRWGLASESRSTLDPDSTLYVNGNPQSQNTRTLDMLVHGDYLYWGEDTARAGGMYLFRAHRTTHQVERVGGTVTGQVRKLTKTRDGRVLIFTSASAYGWRWRPGHDQYMRVYTLTEDGEDFHELARFPIAGWDDLPDAPEWTLGYWYGTAEAFDRLWLSTGGQFDGVDGDVVGWVIPDAPVTPGDATFDARVDDRDLAVLLANWGGDLGDEMTWKLGDFDGDAEVGDTDLSVLLSNWTRPSVAGGNAVPEPTAMALLAIGGMALIGRRPRRRR